MTKVKVIHPGQQVVLSVGEGDNKQTIEMSELEASDAYIELGLVLAKARRPVKIKSGMRANCRPPFVLMGRD